MNEDRHSVPGDFEVIRCDLPAFAGDYTQMDYGDPLAPRTVQRPGIPGRFHLRTKGLMIPTHRRHRSQPA